MEIILFLIDALTLIKVTGVMSLRYAWKISLEIILQQNCGRFENVLYFRLFLHVLKVIVELFLTFLSNINLLFGFSSSSSKDISQVFLLFSRVYLTGLATDNTVI